MVSQFDSINQIIEQWLDKGCIDPHTELMCRSIAALVKEQERTNRQVRDKK